MSDNKKYYYMRVKENFYETEDMVILQSMDNGYLYSDILMKLYLRSLKHDGRLMFKEHIPYNPKMIATITGHNIDVIEKSLRIFKDLNLIDVLDNGAIYMLDMQNFIGETSTEADRIKAYRKKIKEETVLLNGNVQMYNERTPELETELEKELELELEKEDNIPNETKVPCISKNEIETLINKWSELGLQNVISIKPGSKRYIMLNARFKEYGLAQIIQAIENIKKSSFLRGQSKSNFIVCFDWMIKPNNFIKVLEGNYSDNKKEGNTNGSTKQDIKSTSPKTITGEGEELAKRAQELYGDKLADFECNF